MWYSTLSTPLNDTFFRLRFFSIVSIVVVFIVSVVLGDVFATVSLNNESDDDDDDGDDDESEELELDI